jgi:hypothetical protein
MRLVIVAAWSLESVVNTFLGFCLVVLFVFSVAMFIVGVQFFVPVARAYLGGGRAAASRERMAGARRAGNMALMAIVVGPLLAVSVGILILPVVIWFDGFRFLDFLGMLLVTIGVGTLAGLIAAGAFLTAGSLLGRVRKTVKKWKGGGVWDPDLDALA